MAFWKRQKEAEPIMLDVLSESERELFRIVLELITNAVEKDETVKQKSIEQFLEEIVNKENITKETSNVVLRLITDKQMSVQQFVSKYSEEVYSCLSAKRRLLGMKLQDVENHA